jgi:hypothetical protein
MGFLKKIFKNMGCDACFARQIGPATIKSEEKGAQ